MALLSPRKFIFKVLLIGILLIIGNWKLEISVIHAQIPAPAPVPCNQVGANNIEFHSLRPYQASPCQTTVAPSASFCGNDLTLQNAITETYPGSGTCTNSNGVVTCNYNEAVSIPITINLGGAELPIMGNTESVLNSQNASESANDAQKVNGYVSWYLNGVTNRAEYGDTKNTDENTVNYSGPINKLLPSAILDADRIQSLNNAGTTNHNQIVVCTQDGKPIPCYSGNSTPAQGTVYRLGDWNDGSLSPLTTFFNWLGTDIWNKKYPPLPWQFTSDVLYEKAYNEWEGKTCAIVPIINKLVCASLPVISNPSNWSSLFSFVPLSGTEDLKGNVSVDQVSSAESSSADVSVSNVQFSNQAPADLFFPHMEETSELASSLQNTFAYKGADKAGSPTDTTAALCSTVDVRSNKGDNLFANQITGNLSYNASFSCNFSPTQTIVDPACLEKCIGSGISTYICTDNCTKANNQTCTKNVSVNLSTTSTTPLADDLWSRLVAGPASVFKMIFPETNVPGSVGQIIDIPGSTNITYSAPGLTQADTQLKFPHIGGISEYFLKGIQTMLRPKGYGESVEFAPNSATPSNGCKSGTSESVADSAIPSKYLGSFKSNFINVANQFTATCQGPENNLATQCYNYVVNQSLISGVNPAFTLTIWLNESGASNYCFSGPTTQDFGINIPSLYQNFTGQLSEFLKLPDSFSYCRSVPGWTEPMEAFLSRFQSAAGACDPTDQVAAAYYEDIRDHAWQYVTGTQCIKNGKFAISWPTDNSCP